MSFFDFSCVIFLVQNVLIPPNFILLRNLKKESHNNTITVLEAVNERYSAYLMCSFFRRGHFCNQKKTIPETVPVAAFSVLSDP